MVPHALHATTFSIFRILRISYDRPLHETKCTVKFSATAAAAKQPRRYRMTLPRLPRAMRYLYNGIANEFGNCLIYACLRRKICMLQICYFIRDRLESTITLHKMIWSITRILLLVLIQQISHDISYPSVYRMLISNYFFYIAKFSRYVFFESSFE